jgi:PAS domain-containing protein
MRRRVTELETLVQQFDNIPVERKQSEGLLSESQIRIASIVDIANEAIISINEAQDIIIYNKGAENIFGYSPEEAIGQPLAGHPYARKVCDRSSKPHNLFCWL